MEDKLKLIQELAELKSKSKSKNLFQKEIKSAILINDNERKSVTSDSFIDEKNNLKVLKDRYNNFEYQEVIIKKCEDNGEPFIDWDSCPKLRPENVDKHNCEGHIDWDDSENKEEDGQGNFNEELKQFEKEQEQEEKSKQNIQEFFENALAVINQAQSFAYQGQWAKAQENLDLVKNHPHLLLLKP